MPKQSFQVTVGFFIFKIIGLFGFVLVFFFSECVNLAIDLNILLSLDQVCDSKCIKLCIFQIKKLLAEKKWPELVARLLTVCSKFTLVCGIQITAQRRMYILTLYILD